MVRRTLDIDQAARLAFAGYKPHKFPDFEDLIVESLNKKHVQAHLLKNDIVVIPGSNSAFDYLLYNLRMFRVGAKKYRVVDTNDEAGDSGTRWHQGFLAHARIVYDWIKDSEHLDGRKPSLIIGHSLGGASAQILSMSFGVYAVTFAAPRTKSNDDRITNDRLCLNIMRSDDTVPKIPETFFHLGIPALMVPSKRSLLPRHHMIRYIWALSNHDLPSAVPKTWPK